MEMLHYDFMQRAFCAGGLAAILGSILGVYLMLRRQALMADTLSHVSLAGVAIGAILRLNPAFTAFIIAILGGVAIEWIRRSFRAYSEMSIAIIMIGGLSTGVVLMSLNPSMNNSFNSYLFGSVVAVSATQLGMMVGVAGIAAIYFFFLRRPLYLITFDEETAKASGMPVNAVSLSFSVMTGMIVAAVMPVVGVLLVSSLVILPAALAIRLASSFQVAIGLSMVIGVSGVFTGLTASYELDTPPGGTIALVLLVVLLVGLGLRQGWKSFNKRKSLRFHQQESMLAIEGKPGQ